MKRDINPLPANEKLRRPDPDVIDQRQQQIDPTGKHRVDRDRRPDANRKQPGGTRGESVNEGPAS